MAQHRGSCYAGRMSLVATFAMLMLMPATAASIPAVKSAQCPPGYIVSRLCSGLHAISGLLSFFAETERSHATPANWGLTDQSPENPVRV